MSNEQYGLGDAEPAGLAERSAPDAAEDALDDLLHLRNHPPGPRQAQAAVALLRGLNRLEPLPCTNTARDLASRGMCNVPDKPTGGIDISRISTSLGTW